MNYDWSKNLNQVKECEWATNATWRIVTDGRRSRLQITGWFTHAWEKGPLETGFPAFNWNHKTYGERAPGTKAPSLREQYMNTHVEKRTVIHHVPHSCLGSGPVWVCLAWLSLLYYLRQTCVQLPQCSSHLTLMPGMPVHQVKCVIMGVMGARPLVSSTIPRPRH